MSQNGTLAVNREPILLERVALIDCDVQQLAGAGGSGLGGGLLTAMASLTIKDSLIANCDTLSGANTGGAGLAILDQTLTDIRNTTFASNRTGQYGGAVFAQGSTLSITGSRIINNEVSPGVNEGWRTRSARRSSLRDGCLQPAGDRDRVELGHQQQHRPGHLRRRSDQRADQRHALRRQPDLRDHVRHRGVHERARHLRPHGRATQQRGRVARQRHVDRQIAGEQHRAGQRAGLGPAARRAADHAVERRGLGQPAAERRLSRLRVGRRQRHARRQRRQRKRRPEAAAGTGSHVLSVAGTPFSANIALGAVPAATFSASPTNVSNGQPSTLSWNTTAGAFLDGAIDQAVGTIAASGTRSVSPLADTTYRLLAVTDTGGATAPPPSRSPARRPSSTRSSPTRRW